MTDPNDAATTTEGLPDWAEGWIPGTCGCGSRLVEVIDYTGQPRTCCARSGWELGHPHKCTKKGKP